MFRLHFKVYEAVITLKKINEIKQNKKFYFLKFENFYENHPPKGDEKYKRIKFAPCSKSIMANKLLSTSFERPKLTKMAIFKPS